MWVLSEVLDQCVSGRIRLKEPCRKVGGEVDRQAVGVKNSETSS